LGSGDLFDAPSGPLPTKRLLAAALKARETREAEEAASEPAAAPVATLAGDAVESPGEEEAGGPTGTSMEVKSLEEPEDSTPSHDINDSEVNASSISVSSSSGGSSNISPSAVSPTTPKQTIFLIAEITAKTSTRIVCTSWICLTSGRTGRDSTKGKPQTWNRSSAVVGRSEAIDVSFKICWTAVKEGRTWTRIVCTV